MLEGRESEPFAALLCLSNLSKANINFATSRLSTPNVLILRSKTIKGMKTRVKQCTLNVL